MTPEPPQPDPLDLRGEIERLQRRVAELEARLKLVGDVGITIDLKKGCCWWKKARLGKLK